jgi:radical SAM superfamily enzyme YgiQ (UPF0313 family)
MKIKLYLCGGEKPKAEYPLGLGYLKSYCQDVDIEIVKNKEELKDCDLIGLSSNAWGVNEALCILNSTDIPVIIGGQATLWDGLKKYPFKHIVKGEGERKLQSIINNNFDPDIEQIKNLDILPFPDRGKCKKQAPILSSRGCPYNCHFCSSSKFWESVRYHSAEYFIEEVKYIRKTYPSVRMIAIMDDLFIANVTRLSKIYRLWKENNFNYYVTGFIRSNHFTKTIGLIMRDMGFKCVRFGAESGSDTMLKKLNKRTTVENHQKAIDICNEIGLEAQASFMYNLPGETKEEKQETVDFMYRNKGKFRIVGFYKFQPFPGTLYYNNEDLTKIDMRVR